MNTMLIIINCALIIFHNINYNLDNNRLFVQKIMNNPNSIVEICQDSQFVSTNLKINKSREIVIQNYKDVIIKLNQEGFTIEKDEKYPYEDKNEKFKYYIHIIVLNSKTSGAYFYFRFDDENNNLNSWKLVSMKASLDGRDEPEY